MTRIAELQDRLRRLAKRREGEGIYTDAAICEEAAESLSRTGAVKVKALVNSLLDLRDLIMRGKRCVTDTGPAVKPVIELAAVHILDDAANALEALSALEPPAPEGQQEAVAWQHIPNCGVDRESKMVHVTGKVFCDPCIAPLVAALNAASIETVASCCGHGHRPGVIVLRDGRELFIAKDFEEARKVDAAFPTDINGDARPAEQAVTDEMVGAAEEVFFKTDDHGEPSYDMRAALEAAALKAAMEAGR